jgi:transglutaminase-like putative cysteine protease
LRVLHEIQVSWDNPVRSVIAALRLMPRDHEGQTVVSWRIEPSADGRLRFSEDAFSNQLHSFQAEGPIDSLVIRGEGVIDTYDVAGVIRNARETAPPQVYLRDTAETPQDETIRAFADKAVKGMGGALDRAHALMHAVASEPEPTAAAAARRLCAAARAVGLPARFVAGHAASASDHARVEGAHCWTEIHIDGLGWVAFDPRLRMCPTDRHVRVAVGLDQTDVEALRLARVGVGAEAVATRVEVSVS